MPPDEAQRLLTEAYRGIDEGKLLRRTHKELRKQGIDPPLDVQYTAEPRVERFDDGLGITLGADILIYDAFPELDDCRDTFEAALNDLLMERLEKVLKKWLKASPRRTSAPPP